MAPLLCALSLATFNIAGAEQPNVLMIVLDDMNDWVGAMGGHPQARTPNMDRLAKQGVLFVNAHANVAVCAPSRASFMTGIHPLTSKCWGFGNWMENEMLINSMTLGEYAMANGYLALQTSKVLHNSKPGMWSEKGVYADYGPLAYDGKRTTRHPSCPEGMAELGALDATFAPLSDVPSVAASGDAPGYTGWWNARWGAGSPFRYVSGDDRDLMTDEKSAAWIEDKIKVLERRVGEQPFFIGFGIIRPHTPLVVPQKYFDLFPLDEIELPKIKKDDLADVPGDFSDARGHKALVGLKSGYDDSEEGLRRHTQAYLACVAFADDMVGRALDAIENSAFRDNTIVLLFGDHGYHMGEKDHLWKYNLWEETTRIPLIIRDPRYADNAGRTVDHPVSLVDLFPTIRDLCSWSGPTAKNDKGGLVDGHSLRPFLEDPAAEDWEGPDAALSMIASWKSQRPSEQHLSVRSRDFRYTRYYPEGEELYDHRNDPYEWNNLASDPEYAAIKAGLVEQLEAMVPEATLQIQPEKTAATQPAREKSADEKWKDQYFSWHPDADTNQDGELSWSEYKVHKKALDGRQGGE
jgi:arylsulfatase A-like enzyme